MSEMSTLVVKSEVCLYLNKKVIYTTDAYNHTSARYPSQGPADY